MDLERWRFRLTGAVERPVTLTWDELLAMPQQETVCDIHCVTPWSRYDIVRMRRGAAGQRGSGAAGQRGSGSEPSLSSRAK